MRRISTSGAGRPTVVAITSSGSLARVLVVTPASVLVYRVITGQPSTSRIRRTSSGGIDAAPRPATRTPEKSVIARSGWSSISDHCVGTPGRHRDVLVADERSVSAADHGSPAITIVVVFASSSHMRVM